MTTQMSCRAFAVLLLSCLTACGAGSGGGIQGDIEAACLANTNTPPEGCECLARGAVEELSEPAAAWLAAAMAGDTEAALELKEDVPLNELMDAGMFMVNYAQECALPEAALEQMQ